MDTVRLASVTAFVAGLALLVAVAFVLIVPPAAPQVQLQPTVEIVVNGGEVGADYGFALKGGVIVAPGPTIKVKAGEVVKITFVNVGQIPHSFAIVREKRFNADPAFNADIGSPARPIEPGRSSSVVFVADKPGTYFYICRVPGHIERGMFGVLVVEG